MEGWPAGTALGLARDLTRVTSALALVARKGGSMRYTSKDGDQRTITVERLYHAVGPGEYIDMSVDLRFEGDKFIDIGW